MKRVLLKGLILISIFSLMGCYGKSDEIVIRDDVRIETVDGEKMDIKVTPIENKDKAIVVFAGYENGAYYGNSFMKGNEKSIESADNIVYEIGKENSIKEYAGDSKSLEFNKGSMTTYFGEGKVEIMNIETGKKIKVVDSANENFRAERVKGIEEVIFCSDSSSGKSNLSIMNMKTGEEKVLNSSIKGQVAEVYFYENTYYVLGEDLNLYKIKEQDGKLVVEETIVLINEFGIKAHGDFLLETKLMSKGGEIFLSVTDNGKHTENCAEGVFRYNLKTGEKYKTKSEVEGLRVVDYHVESKIILLGKVSQEGEKSVCEIYLGRFNEDRVENISKVILPHENIKLMTLMFNDKGNELIIGYKLDGNEEKIEYSKINISELEV